MTRGNDSRKFDKPAFQDQVQESGGARPARTKLAAGLLLGALLLGGCVTTSSPDGSPIHPFASKPIVWTAIGEAASNQAEFAIDLNNIKRYGNLARYISRTMYEKSSTKSGIKNVPDHKSAISLWQIDCARRVYNLVGTSFYNSRGVMIYNESYDIKEEKAEPVRRGSASEIQFIKVCEVARKLPSAPFVEPQFKEEGGK